MYIIVWELKRIRLINDNVRLENTDTKWLEIFEIKKI